MVAPSLYPILFRNGWGPDVPLTLSDNEITDATRATGTQGDGLSQDGSYGIWPDATNLVLNGGFETDTTGWGQVGSSTLTRVTAGQKFGAACAELVMGASTSAGIGQLVTQAAVNGSPYTGSLWCLVPNGKAMRLRLLDGVPTVLGTTNFTGTGAWQRVSVTANANADERVALQLLRNDGLTTAFTINTDGVQIEAGSVATPYIETDGGTAARSAARVQLPAQGLFTTTQGWVAIRFRAGYTKTSGGAPPNASNLAMWFAWATDTTHFIALYHGGGGAMPMQRRNGGSNAGPTLAGATWTQGDFITLVGYWTASGLGISLNGAAFTTASGTEIPATLPATADIGSGGSIWTAPMDGDALWFLTGKGVLTSADAARIHGFGNNDPDPRLLPAHMECTGVWDATSRVFRKTARGA